MKSRWKWLASFFLTAVLSAPAWAMATSANSALPGTLNYVEGEASIGTQTLDSKAIGSVELQPGQSLVTGHGKAELLLTPGVFLRVGDDSSVKMISPSLTNTEIGVDKGRVMIDVAEIHRENDIRVVENGTTTRLLKTGLYDFDQRSDQLHVFNGKAWVGDNGHEATVKGGHEVILADNSSLKVHKFDKKSLKESDLYRWSDLRSTYLAEANVNAAGTYYVDGWGPWGSGWWGTGWYWNPWYDAYTFIPADGIFYSPFGCAFYSPWYVERAPFFVTGYGLRGGVPYRHRFDVDARNWGHGSHYFVDHDRDRVPNLETRSAGSRFLAGPRMRVPTRGFRGFERGGLGARVAPPMRSGGFSGGRFGFHTGGFRR
jgi:hypothetical protein